MTTKKSISTKFPTKSILSYIRDIPNICSLAGLGCSLLAIYFLIIGIYEAAMIGMIWAVAFDWADGLIARKMKGRTGDDQKFGGQLDLLIDIVSYGVTPAILILSYSNFNPFFLIPAFIMLVFGAIRLSYFSTFGLSSDAKYTGLAIDNNSIIQCFSNKNTKTFWKPCQRYSSGYLYNFYIHFLWMVPTLKLVKTT